MPGEFSKNNRPKLPGAYVNFVARTVTRTAVGTGAIVALPFTHTWGPYKTATLVSSVEEFEAIFGTDASPGRIAVKQAFTGEGGVDGRFGAGSVLCYRFGGSAGAKATRTLTNTASATPAVRLTARYEGTRGNRIQVTIQDLAGSATNDELVIENVDDGSVLERFSYPQTDMTNLVAQINGTGAYAGNGSDWLVADGPGGGAVVTGTALTAITDQALTGGNDGSTLAAGDWTAALSSIEISRFGIFAPFDLTDATGAIQTSIKTWAQGLNQRGKRFLTVFGGAAGESVATATGVTVGGALYNDPNIVRLGVGTYVDAEHGTLSTSQLAPRLAGIFAGRSQHESATAARLPGLTITTGPTDSEQVSLLDAGVISIARDSNLVAPTRLTKALTTWTTTTNTSKPYLIFRNPKFVLTMHALEMELTEWAEAEVIGKAPINDKTRAAVVAELGGRLKVRERAGILQDGSSIGIDQDPPPSDDDEFIAVVYGVKFGRSAEQVFATITVG